MNPPPAEISYGVGGCGFCRHIFLITPQLRNCPLCDRPASGAIPFSGEAEDIVRVAEEAAAEASAEEPPTPIAVACPYCSKLIQLEVTQELVTAVRTPEPPPAEEPAAAAPTVTPSSEAPAPSPSDNPPS